MTVRVRVRARVVGEGEGESEVEGEGEGELIVRSVAPTRPYTTRQRTGVLSTPESPTPFA